MLATRPAARLSMAPRLLLCRPCANLASPSHARLASRSRPFSTTPWRCGEESFSLTTPPGSGEDSKGGLAGLGRSKEKVDRSQMYALPSTPARTRFAPSPTGYLHLGSLRTALYNYLLARATGGQFIVRVEDTDRTRVVDDAEKRLLDDLKWANLTWDEGPDVGGPYGPYRQSERLDKYRPYTDKLLESGAAYRCFCSAEHLEKHRESALALNQTVRYPGTCRDVPAEESADRASRGEAHVLRFRSEERVSFVDRVYGKYAKNEDEDDFILVKGDGFPTYHFANVIDDHLMKITHVIRGAEWLISTPKHIALNNALGFTPPDFSHVGLLTDAEGQKLSKRNADVDVSSYRHHGILPSALNNWLVLMGWGIVQDPENKKKSELMIDMGKLISSFSWKFTKGNAKVNPGKLLAFQYKHGEHLLEDPAANRAVLVDALVRPAEAFIRDTERRRKAAPEQEATTSPSGGTLDYSKLGELLPQFATPEGTEEHLLRILRTGSRYPGPAEMVLDNAQFIWGIPPHVYATAPSIAPKQVRRVLVAVEGRLGKVERASDWEARPVQSPLQRALDAAVVDMKRVYKYERPAQDAVYEVLRFALAGDPLRKSKPAAKAMFILGREETKVRFERAREAMKLMEGPPSSVFRSPPS